MTESPPSPWNPWAEPPDDEPARTTERDDEEGDFNAILRRRLGINHSTQENDENDSRT